MTNNAESGAARRPDTNGGGMLYRDFMMDLGEIAMLCSPSAEKDAPLLSSEEFLRHAADYAQHPGHVETAPLVTFGLTALNEGIDAAISDAGIGVPVKVVVPRQSEKGLVVDGECKQVDGDIIGLLGATFPDDALPYFKGVARLLHTADGREENADDDTTYILVQIGANGAVFMDRMHFRGSNGHATMQELADQVFGATAEAVEEE